MKNIKIIEEKRKTPIERNKKEIKTLKLTINNEITKYDRQIRLFGLTTQLVLNNTYIKLIIPNPKEINYLVSEIIKNFKCLGIKEIITNYEEPLYNSLFNYKGWLINTNEETLNNFIKIKINYKNFLNNNLNSKEDEVMNLKDNFIKNINIQFYDEEIIFFICQTCLIFYIKDIYNQHCICNNNILDNKEMIINNECLFGAFFVQEIIKMLSGKNFIKFYSLDN